MKRYLILLFALAISLTSYGQIDETNNIVRNNTLSPARVANALDIMKVWSTSGTDTYAISVTVGSHSPYAGGLTYTTGDIFKIKIGITNTSGTTSLNVNTDGAIPLKDAEGNNFGIGDLAANSIHAFYYDGTNFREISGSGGGGSGTPGGSDTYVQYNDASAFGGEADFTYDETTNTLTVDNAAVDTEAYDATGWNGDLTVPTKDALRDKIETMGSPVGAQDLFITGPAMWPKYTSGCQFAGPFEIGGTATFMSLDFDQTTGESAQFQVSLPRNWNNGTMTFTVYWTATSGSGTVQWDISGVSFANDDALSTALGTIVEVDDTLIATSDLHISPTSTAVTLSGTPADGDLLLINIARDPSEDTLSADAKLLGVRVTLTLDAATSE
jgi:hypothetical protein